MYLTGGTKNHDIGYQGKDWPKFHGVNKCMKCIKIKVFNGIQITFINWNRIHKFDKMKAYQLDEMKFIDLMKRNSLNWMK